LGLASRVWRWASGAKAPRRAARLPACVGGRQEPGGRSACRSLTDSPFGNAVGAQDRNDGPVEIAEQGRYGSNGGAWKPGVGEERRPRGGGGLA